MCIGLAWMFTVFIIQMNSLKKALAKDDPKKYQKSKIQISGLKRTNQWQDLDSMMEKKIQRKNIDLTLEEAFKKIIQNNFVNGELKDTAKLYRELKEKYVQQSINETSPDYLHKILTVLRKAAQKEESAVFKKCILLSIEKMERYEIQKKVKENKKALEEYNKLLKSINPGSKIEQKSFEGQKALKKLMHSTSAANLKIRLTREEYLFQQDDNRLRKKKSLDLKNHSKAHSHSTKNIDATNKLQAFLKDNNMKLVKTKIQYDYSAILEVSKSNIQSRNKTAFIEPKNEKEVFAKATKGKKDQAFVFYRPQKKH